MAVNGIGQTDHPHSFRSPRTRAVEALAQLRRVSKVDSSTDPLPDFSFGDLPAADPTDETSLREASDIPLPPDDAGAPMPLPQKTDIEGLDEHADAADLQETHPEEVLSRDPLVTEELALETRALEARALEELALEDPTLEDPAMEESALDDLVDTIVLIEAGDDDGAEALEAEPEPEPDLDEAASQLMQARFQSALDAATHTVAEDQPGDLLDMLA